MNHTTSRDAMGTIARSIEGTGVASADDYDLRTILEDTHEFTSRGFIQTATVEEFWASVERNEKAPAR